MAKNMFYNREKRLSLSFNDASQDFILIALSAKDQEIVMTDARITHANIVKQLLEAAETIRSIYLLQEIELLTDTMIRAEHDQFLAKAALTLPEDDAGYLGKIEAKAEVIKSARRMELQGMDKGQLADKLVSMEIDRQIHMAWTLAVLEATLAKTLHEDNRQRLFASVDEMKASLPPEVLEKLYEAQMEFISEIGNAQVFLKPHTSVS